MNMKRIALVATIGMFVAILGGSLAMAQNAPLGDYARQARKQKGHQAPAAKTFDNDNIPKDDKLSVVGQPPTETADAGAATGNAETAPATGDATPPAAAAAPASGDTDTAGQPASATDKKPAEDERAQKQKMFKDWQGKIQAQQGQIDVMTRELDLANREYRLRAAAFYADAGNRLRNAGAWDKEDAQYKDQMADKQKKLEEAKKQLEDLQEQARKAGVPSSMRE
jgi:hypothetical protein